MAAETQTMQRWRERAAAVTAERQRNREAMPLVSAMVDEAREVFGDGVRVVWAGEVVEEKK